MNHDKVSKDVLPQHTANNNSTNNPSPPEQNPTSETVNSQHDLIDHPPPKRINMMSRDELTAPASMEVTGAADTATATATDESMLADEATTANDQPMSASNADDAEDGIVLLTRLELRNRKLISLMVGSRAEATFQLCIRDFSKFRESKENRLSAEACIVRNLPWKILAMSKQLNNKEFVLGFFLQCNADSDSNRWSVAATAELRLLHASDSTKNLVKSKPCISSLGTPFDATQFDLFAQKSSTSST